MTAKVLIYSNHHKAWWGPNGSGYYTSIASAGRYNEADTAQWMGRGCYCCEVPEVLVPVPVEEAVSTPEKEQAWSRSARGAATRKAKREGRVNKHYDPERAW